MSLIDLSEIDFYKLKSRGYSKIVFDKDNTLTAPYSVKLHPPFTQAWYGGRRHQIIISRADCKNVFGVENIVIVSNSAGSPDDAGFRQAIEIEQSLGVSVLHHVEKVNIETLLMYIIIRNQEVKRKCLIILKWTMPRKSLLLEIEY